MLSIAVCRASTSTGTSSPRLRRGRARSVFVCERPLADVPAESVQLLVGQGGARPAMALAACVLWGDPASSLKTVGVTGTNGKTTTTYFLRSVLDEHGWPTAVIGTLGGPRTTPESPDLQRALASARDGSRTAVALEVTSHALMQHRARRLSPRRSRLHEPEPGPPRLPRDDGGLLRCQGQALHTRACPTGGSQRGRPVRPATARRSLHPDGDVSLSPKPTSSRWA